MGNIIIWHWLIEKLVGTLRRNDADATSLRRIDVVTTSCAYWELAPPWPPNILNFGPQYSKPSYAYGITKVQIKKVKKKYLLSIRNTYFHIFPLSYIFCHPIDARMYAVIER